MKSKPKSVVRRKKVVGWALVHKRRGNIMYMNDGFYSPLISVSKKNLEDSYNNHYTIVPVTITYSVPLKAKGK